MKCPIYLRVAKTSGRKGFMVAASTTANNTPLVTNKGYRSETWYPTIAFAVEINLPDELFSQAERVIAELNINMSEARISSEIFLPEGIKVKSKARNGIISENQLA